MSKSQLSRETNVGLQLLAMLSSYGERRIGVIQVFIDESGTHPETPVLSVAGCYGTQEQWELFREKWEAHSHGFHAKKSTRKFPLLCEAIETSKINALLISVGKEKFKTVASSQLKTAIGNPYSACAFLCAFHLCAEIKSEPISFVIEHGQPNVEFVKRTLEVMMDARDSNIAAVATAKKEDFIELHTADFVSHISSSYDVPWMQRLFDAKRLSHGHLTEGALIDASQKVVGLFHKARQMRKEAKNKGV